MNKQVTIAMLALLAFTQPVLAVVAVGTRVGVPTGSVLSAVGLSLPVGIGGVAAIAALSLVIGVQLIKRRKK